MKKACTVLAISTAFAIASTASAEGLSNATFKYSNQEFDRHKGELLLSEDRPAKSLWDRIYSTDLSPFDILPDVTQDDWNRSSYEERQEYFSEYQDGMRSMESVADYREAEGNLIRLIARAYPRMGNYWNNSYQHRDVQVVQSSNLIDLNRVYFNKFEMGAYQTDEGSFYSALPEHHATESMAYNSQERMAMGLAPIGPDGTPIILCRLNDDPRASYFEMSQREGVRLLNALSTGMSLNRACLTDEIFGDYWKVRLKDI